MFEKRDWVAELPSVAELDHYLEGLEAELERVRRLRETVRHLRDGAGVDGPAEKPDAKPSLRDVLLEYLQEHETFTRDELLEAASIRLPAVQPHLVRTQLQYCAKRGEVRKSGRATWVSLLFEGVPQPES